MDAAFAAAMGAAAGPFAVAVSGGGDSLALMHLLAGFAAARGLPPPVVLTVDHGLRPAAASDARQVAAWAGQAGIAAHILTWRGPGPATGIEAAARAARYRLMGDWLMEHDIAALHVGHTLDDQAETFLLRLARGSGLDGLSAMQAAAPWPLPGFPGLTLRRPLLGIARANLRAHLKAIDQPWLEDPMNDDAAFDRVKMRKIGTTLAEAGLTPSRIAAAAAHLGRARTALESVTEAVLTDAVRPCDGGLLLDPAALAAAPREVGLRALAAVLGQVSGQAYRPRFEALERLFDRMTDGPPKATLQGCRIAPAPAAQRCFGAGTLLVRREGPRKADFSSKAEGTKSGTSP